MDRSIVQDLMEWQKNPRRLPLILCGPRQVGKSYVVMAFAKRFFKQVVVNFELALHLKSCFSDLDPQRIINQLDLLIWCSHCQG